MPAQPRPRIRTDSMTPFLVCFLGALPCLDSGLLVASTPFFILLALDFYFYLCAVDGHFASARQVNPAGMPGSPLPISLGRGHKGAASLPKETRAFPLAAAGRLAVYRVPWACRPGEATEGGTGEAQTRKRRGAPEALAGRCGPESDFSSRAGGSGR